MIIHQDVVKNGRLSRPFFQYMIGMYSQKN